jgi:formamidopyrimidine-DNA glycosylase
VDIHNSDRIFPQKRRFANVLSGATIYNIGRRGKNILIQLSNDYTLWVHLKMTGHFEYCASSEPVEKHDHIIFHFVGNGCSLRFNDYRRFGRLRLYPTSDIMKKKGLAELGPEPLDLSFDNFLPLVKSSRRMIKPALLDQTFIAGLGNIYADEALYLSRIHPRRLTDSLSVRKIKELHGHIQHVLRRGIRLMGTSVDSFSGLNGRPGRYQKYLLVYGREGEPCTRCERPIRREKIGSRSAHYCPYCQRRR